mmetsp:Transcript_53823/g.125479  ORF Transcript_53823/g.125479 Transcript_53823/m.125479 type:complete len:268 (+) Transcript_53823:427-1230(+)
MTSSNSCCSSSKAWQSSPMNRQTSYSWPARKASLQGFPVQALLAERPKSISWIAICPSASFTPALWRCRSPCTSPASNMSWKACTTAVPILLAAASSGGANPCLGPEQRFAHIMLCKVLTIRSMRIQYSSPPGTRQGPSSEIGDGASFAFAKARQRSYSFFAKSSSMTFATSPVSSSRKTVPMNPLPSTRRAPVGQRIDDGASAATARTGSKQCSSITSTAIRASRRSETGFPLQAARRRRSARTAEGMRDSASFPEMRSRYLTISA